MDFGPSRSKLFRNAADDYLQVHGGWPKARTKARRMRSRSAKRVSRAIVHCEIVAARRAGGTLRRSN